MIEWEQINKHLYIPGVYFERTKRGKSYIRIPGSKYSGHCTDVRILNLVEVVIPYIVRIPGFIFPVRCTDTDA